MYHTFSLSLSFSCASFATSEIYISILSSLITLPCLRLANLFMGNVKQGFAFLIRENTLFCSSLSGIF